MAKNKVMFGVSNLHFGTYEDDGQGNITLGAPFKVPGTVNISLEPDSEEQKFYADNTVYYSVYSDNGLTGEVENALFPDEFKLKFMNYIKLDDGGVAQIKGMQNVPTYMMFQSNGDAENRRMIMYNVTIGHISREHATTEETIEPQTATMPFTVNGDNNTGISRVSYAPGDAPYETMFTTPPVPALPTQSE